METGCLFVAGRLLIKADQLPQMALFTGIDVSALTSAFVEFGGKIFMKNVNEWVVDPHTPVYKGIKKPYVLPKLKADGGPRPYRAADDTTNNGASFTDRTLTVYQSKWDYDVDPEVFRNKYLANNDEVPFYQFIIDQVAKEYLGKINDSVLWLGDYNGAGSAAADIATGWGTIIADEITALTLTPVATGALSSANAVTKVEQLAAALPAWMKSRDVVIFCSWTNFENYRTHYRTLNSFGFQPRANGQYYVDGYANIKLRPVSWLGTSGRIVATVADNMIIGTDADSITVDATKRRNIIEVRQMMPIGLQIADLEAIVVNDQA